MMTAGSRESRVGVPDSAAQGRRDTTSTPDSRFPTPVGFPESYDAL